MSAGVPAQRRKRAGVRPQARLAVGRGRPAGTSPGAAGWRRGRSVRWARMATVSRTDEAIGAIVRVNIAAHAREESVRCAVSRRDFGARARAAQGDFEPGSKPGSRWFQAGFKPGSSRVRAGFERGSSGVQAQARGERRDGARRHARSAGVRRAPTRLHSGGVSESRPRTPAGRGGGVRALAGTVRVTPGPCLAVPRVFAGARDDDGRAMGASAPRLRGRGSGRRAVPAAAWCGRTWRRRISVDAEDRRGAPGSSSVIGNRACICRSDMAPLQSRGGACRSARVSMSRSTAGSVTSTSAGGAAASSARAPVSPSSAASAS